ncbi:hypothetical protein J437_LFUL018183 [Ladona fulva]|uniref:Uncharacterized protein n=1 Tax=Ladona fulva TaxID=123851 RepID=A0A8K0KPX7_LADFU|nr:hypothetical protein J437_LFUL018183 [Ladona fulva]
MKFANRHALDLRPNPIQAKASSSSSTSSMSSLSSSSSPSPLRTINLSSTALKKPIKQERQVSPTPREVVKCSRHVAVRGGVLMNYVPISTAETKVTGNLELKIERI